MLGTAVQSALESIVGPEGLSAGDGFAVDGMAPRVAVAPATPEQVAEVMRYANAEGLAVIPWGGGAHMHLANVPARYDIGLSLSRLDGVVEHEPDDLTATCRAGTPLAALQERLAASGSMVTLGPLANSAATVGGALAANAYGPSRHAYGTARDFTIGLKIVTADGRLTKAGGRVVKNVAGYDLCKLYIGSLGTLGVIVEATFKLSPLPKAQRSMGTSFATAAEACGFASRLRGEALPLRSVTLFRDGDRYALAIDMAGETAAVERACERIETMARERDTLGASHDEPAAVPSLEEAQLFCRVSALPTRMAPLIDAIEAPDRPRIVALPTVGVLYAGWKAAEGAQGILERLRAAIAPFDASAVVERCPLELKRTIDVFGEPPEAFGLMREVKRRFDPNGVLSPGRFVGRL